MAKNDYGTTDTVTNTQLNTLGTEVNGKLGVAPRVLTLSNPGATPAVNVSLYDAVLITGQTANITSFTVTGTAASFQKMWIAVTGTASRTIAWGSSFEAGPVALPTTTTGTQRLDVGFVYNPTTSKFRCMASGSA